MRPTSIYVGTREAVMAEVGTPDYYNGKYLLHPMDEAGTAYTPEGMDTKRDLKGLIAEYKAQHPNLRVIWLS